MYDSHLESKGEIFEIDESVSDMTDEEVKSDIKTFREKILSGDKKAWKKALRSTARMYADGGKKMEKLIKDNPGNSNYELIYPDGSTIIFNAGTVQKTSSDNLVRPSGEYKETYMSTSNLSSGYWIIRNVSWRF